MGHIRSLVVFGSLILSLAGCTPTRPKVPLVPMQEWGYPGKHYDGKTSRFSQAAAAICLHDTRQALDTAAKGWDSWPTRRRLMPCMHDQGMAYIDKSNIRR